MSTSVTIRNAVASDITAITKLLGQLAEAEGHSSQVEIEKLHAALFEESERVALRALVAELDGKFAAVTLYYGGYDVLTNAYGYHLADFVVDASCRRQGVGKELFTALARQNLDEGGEWISLTVLHTNASAQGFYKALGMMHVPVEFYAAGRSMLQTITLLQN